MVERIRVKGKGKIEAFSKQKLAKSIQHCGGKSTFAKDIADMVYSTIALSLYDSVVSTQEIKKRTHQLLLRKDAKVAKEYERNA